MKLHSWQEIAREDFSLISKALQHAVSIHSIKAILRFPLECTIMTKPKRFAIGSCQGKYRTAEEKHRQVLRLRETVLAGMRQFGERNG